MVRRLGARLRTMPDPVLELMLVLFAYATDHLSGGQLQYLFRFPVFAPLAGSTSVMVCSEWSRFQGFGRSEEKACKGWGVAWLALGLIRGIGLGCSLPVLEALVDQLKD